MNLVGTENNHFVLRTQVMVLNPVLRTPRPLKGGELVPRADIETYIRNGYFALENDINTLSKQKR